MKRLVFAAVVLFAGIPAMRVAAVEPLTKLEAVHRLSNTEADKGLPVALEATVTYFRAYRRNLFVQDGNAGVFVKAITAARLVPGDRVLIKGVTKGAFRPTIVSSDVTVLRHVALPRAVPATFDGLIRGQYDSILVTVRGVARAANLDMPSAYHEPGATLKILTDGGYVDAEVDSGDADALGRLLDAEVAVTGVAGGRFDGKHVLTGVVLHVSSLTDIRILKPASMSPWTLPVTPMDQILGVYHVKNLTRRVRVHGTVTYFEPGAALVLQDGARSLWISTRSFSPMHIGDQADATGFPTVTAGFLDLAASEIRDSGIAVPINPQPVSWQQVTSSQHIFDLVSMVGQVVVAVREAAQDEYVLVSDGYQFSAIYRHPVTAGPGSLAPMRDIPVGSRIRVTGICVPDDADPFGHNVHIDILLRSPDDIALLAEPSWLNVQHLIRITAVILFLVVAAGMRGWYLEHRVRREIVSLAYLEQRRGRILEDINHSKPLAEILERITELVSVRLNGAACWCQIADGATLGNRPAQLASVKLRTVEHPIAARSGPPLGTLCAAFHARTRPRAVETDALAMAAELATLAIETSRLYSDLVHRSEFDLLTGVQNRFAMEKALDAMIIAARQSAGAFGLIFIDLNEFKQVNDVYGHQAGDLYLQEISQRMKRQLRPGDSLSRLGGDEFAVLVSNVHNRADVEVIAVRLECCFDKPFKGDGYVLRGSASFGIALYPEDANSADGLLSAADAAMYVAKYTRMGKDHAPEAQPDSELTPKDPA